MEFSNFNPSSQSEDEPISFFDRIANSILLKMLVIFILVLVLLIPMSLINDLVEERKAREQSVSHEIASKWGKEQVISAPILAVPYQIIEENVQVNDKGEKTIVKSTEEEWLFLLPDKADVMTAVKPESLKRGIYNSVVYNANVDMKVEFAGFDSKELPVKPEEINWAKTKVIFGVEDVKGLATNPTVLWGDSLFVMKSNSQYFKLFPNTMAVDFPLTNILGSQVKFDMQVQLKGSKSLNFLPLANQTNIEAIGDWGNPSFSGGYLPEGRDVTDFKFSAKWQIPNFSRKLPSQWSGENTPIYSFMGLALLDDNYVDSEVTKAVATANVATDMDMVQINFLPEVNNYQKTNRVAKYGILIIVLTFASLFFTEIIKKQRVHLIQYILIGVAMVLFYSLLLAISEHLGFNMAYLIASIATIALIGSFVRMITANNNTAILFAGILGLFYSFIFVLMQLRDYSLIVGTVGVFIILAVLMRVSTKVNWYQFDKK